MTILVQYEYPPDNFIISKMTPEPHQLYGYDNENSQAESFIPTTRKLSKAQFRQQLLLFFT